jgi:hypothetical protein
MMTAYPSQPLPLSPHKQANPLGWPFGALPPKVLSRLLNQRRRDELSKVPIAPF